jgi:hypothetical protein
LGYQAVKNCTLWTLMSPWWKGVFFASFLFRRWKKK